MGDFQTGDFIGAGERRGVAALGLRCWGWGQEGVAEGSGDGADYWVRGGARLGWGVGASEREQSGQWRVRCTAVCLASSSCRQQQEEKEEEYHHHQRQQQQQQQHRHQCRQQQ